jgi:hypothetical protein
VVKMAVQSGLSALPQSYQDDYGTQLLREKSLTTVLGLPAYQLEAITGAIYQHAPESEVRTELQRFLAIISHLYRSFTAQAKAADLHIPLDSSLPPLAVFQHVASHGPFTFVSDAMNNLIGTEIAVVSLPSAYRRYPVLWPSLAHETSGHDIKAASGNLLKELTQAVRALFRTDPLPADFSDLTTDKIFGILWSYWLNEAAADVYGILNMGPAFALNFASYLAAFRYLSNPATFPLPSFVTQAGGPGYRFLDPHPLDILRPYLAIGVIENLNALSETVRQRYIALLKAITQRCAGGIRTISVQGFAPVSQERPDVACGFGFEIPLDNFLDVARRVGAHLSTVALPTFLNQSVQVVETWDDADEALAQHISETLQQGASVVSMGNPAQLLAGATLALFADARKFDIINTQLEVALDQSYQLDPVWGTTASL